MLFLSFINFELKKTINDEKVEKLSKSRNF